MSKTLNSVPQPLTIEEATYRMVRSIQQTIRPLAILAQRAEGTESEVGTTEKLLMTLEALVEGQAQNRALMETIIARLETPIVEKLLQATNR